VVDALEPHGSSDARSQGDIVVLTTISVEDTGGLPTAQ
jgi:hypothetical protein